MKYRRKIASFRDTQQRKTKFCSDSLDYRQILCFRWTAAVCGADVGPPTDLNLQTIAGQFFYVLNRKIRVFDKQQPYP